MRINEKVLSCVCFLGREADGSFLAFGTGFLTVVATEGRQFQNIVTCRHVIEMIGGDEVCVRLNLRDGTVERGLVETAAWVFHPDPAVDIAVCPTHIPPERYDINHIHMDLEVADDEVFEQENIGFGDEVFMAGMFTRHIGTATNLPIVRTGTLAGIPTEKVHTNRGFVFAYLIEARSIAGLSGSPVFLHMAPLRVMSDGQVRTSQGKTHYFLGVMQGHHVTQDPVDVASPDDYTPGAMDTGIGVVLPAIYVRQVLDMPQLKKERQRIARKVQDDSGFVEDAVKVAALPTKAENPQHKEDFNSLLSAAARKRPQDGQT